MSEKRDEREEGETMRCARWRDSESRGERSDTGRRDGESRMREEREMSEKRDEGRYRG